MNTETSNNTTPQLTSPSRLGFSIEPIYGRNPTELGIQLRVKGQELITIADMFTGNAGAQVTTPGYREQIENFEAAGRETIAPKTTKNVKRTTKVEVQDETPSESFSENSEETESDDELDFVAEDDEEIETPAPKKTAKSTKQPATTIETVLKAFQTFIKADESNKKKASKILKALGVASVRELVPAQYNDAIKALK